MFSSSVRPCFDGHNDLLLRLWLMDDPTAGIDAFFHGLDDGHIDYPRCQLGGFSGGLFAVFVPPASYFSAHGNISPPQIVAQQIALAHRLAAGSAGRLQLCRSVADIECCRQSGALAMVLHIEGAEGLDPQLTCLSRWYQEGVRSLGPFWNTPNAFGEGVNGAFPGSPDTGSGLTDAGKALITACNRQRLMIDLSHMNEKAFWQTAALSDAPLVASHSNAHALCAQPRNLTDAQLKAIAASGGLVGVNFGNAFLRADGRRDADTPITRIVEHICYLVDRLGEDGVAFGSDFDGTGVPQALGDVSGLPRLLAALSAAGFSEALIEKLRCNNWLSLLRRTWGE
ncbi:peptidase [Erwinia sp. OLTSP20]|uniref:dipeptidase n=1 Tax=unclassified Erwinia TaxID=2622719 RepID=UPI000C19E501|nr:MULTISPECIES: dipeptidase [unclassified Erwinia]PIJ50713.1 peptidase [Erwinia sp. OAMSP11]PIJ75383.1 peptidase [Erwinia sp. OLSSP12]PIJ81881.1 peptidase [Erwinia sp. OLCASP19]PIJ84536.1 peptidase [Erwinia sp. OLMTSP26]PIJ86883.1 peptidase [Erwinia sp. OLMDSP33]